MGRRALRSIDPSLDLSRHFYAFDELPSPWSAAALFDRVAPLEIDVGSGKGLFLKGASAACLDHDFLGIERSRKYARFAAARLAKSGIRNAAVTHGDGLRLFDELLEEESVRAVHVYFPDPWWKARHKKRRIMTERFVKNVERCLQGGGRLHFRTDVREYFETSLETIADYTWPFRGDGVGRMPAVRRSRISDALRTTHEAQWATRLRVHVSQGGYNHLADSAHRSA